MLISRTTLNVLAASLLALGLAACTTTKAPETAAQPSAAAQQAAADQTKGAETAAAGTGSGVESQAMADADKAKAEAAEKARQMAALLDTRVFYFDFDSSTIHDGDMDGLKAHAAFLSQHPAARVQVNGHTDERGTREYNMALGERRAKAVAAFLTANGAKASQLDVVSYGKEKPAVEGHDEAAWAKNRRVELVYTADKP
jgi:peptidoglycan-associated lipoprotein